MLVSVSSLSAETANPTRLSTGSQILTLYEFTNNFKTVGVTSLGSIRMVTLKSSFSVRGMVYRVLSIFVLLSVAACQTPGGSNRVQLTPDEVKATFIDIPWHGPGGAFLFRSDGTYTYQEHSASNPRGTWSYIMEDDGTLTGVSTSYTFYKGPSGYAYYHSRSGQTYVAYPNRSAPFAN